MSIQCSAPGKKANSIWMLVNKGKSFVNQHPREMGIARQSKMPVYEVLTTKQLWTSIWQQPSFLMDSCSELLLLVSGPNQSGRAGCRSQARRPRPVQCCCCCFSAMPGTLFPPQLQNECCGDCIFEIAAWHDNSWVRGRGTADLEKGAPKGNQTKRSEGCNTFPVRTG